MIYGDIYSKIPDKEFAEISGIRPLVLVKLAKVYFKFFGFPDVASHGRFPIVMRMLKPKKGDKILDGGCGNGIYANSLAFYFGCLVVGCDLDKKRIAMAQEMARTLQNKAQFFGRKIEKLDFPQKSFDKIICTEVVEHIKDDASLIKKFNFILKKQGVLVLSTTKKVDWTELEEKEYFENAEEGEHVRSGYDFRELKKKLEEGGLRILGWEPYYRFFTRMVVLAQHRIYKKKYRLPNMLTYPLFLIFTKLDLLLPRTRQWNSHLGWYRGFVIRAVKIKDLS